MYAIQWHLRLAHNGLVASTPKLAAALFSTTTAFQRNARGNSLHSRDKNRKPKQEISPTQDLQNQFGQRDKLRKMVPAPGVDLSPHAVRGPPPTGAPPTALRNVQVPKAKDAKASKRDAKVQPSQQSGGIPNPTQQYLSVAANRAIRTENPQNLLLVIDLNGTLLYRPDRRQPTKFIPRPNAELFLTYCIETFHVVIWSSAREENVGPMVATLLTPKLREKIIQIWGRRKFNLSPLDYDKRVICYKRLDTVWQDPKIAQSHPERAFGRVWDQTNTILIDDTADKAKSEPYNIVEVPEWSGDLSDNTMPVVHDFLNHLSLHTNVSAILRTNPFTAHLKEIQLRPSAAESQPRAGLPR